MNEPVTALPKLLLLATGCTQGDYQLGQDMVFFRSNKGGVLQELMMMRKDKIASNILANATAPGATSRPRRRWRGHAWGGRSWRLEND